MWGGMSTNVVLYQTARNVNEQAIQWVCAARSTPAYGPK